MDTDNKPYNKHYKCRLGFPITPVDEIAMRRAIRKSILFMSSYGKGAEVPMVDLSHYANSEHSQLYPG